MNLRRFAVVGVACLLVVAALVVTPTVPFLFAKLAAPRVMPQGWHLSVDAAGGTLLTQLEFRGVTLANTAGSTTIRIGKLKYLPWSNSVVVARPTIELRPIPESALADTLFVLPPLPRVTINKGSVTYYGENSLVVTVDSLNATCVAGNNSSVGVDLLNLRYRIDAPDSVAAGTASGRLRMLPGWIEAEELHTEFRTEQSKGSLTATGSVALFGSMRAALQLALHMRRAEMTSETEANLNGSLRPLDLAMAAQSVVSLGAWGESKISWDLRADDRGVGIDSLRGQVQEATFSGAANYDLGDNSIGAVLHLRGLMLENVPGSLFTGKLGGTTSARFQFDETDTFLVQSRLKAEDVDLGPLGKADLSIDGRYDNSGVVSLALRSNIGELTATGPFQSPEEFQLALTGVLYLDPVLATGSEPVAVRGKMEPDSILVALDTPSVLVGGQRFGPLQLHLVMKEEDRLHGSFSLEEDRATAAFALDLNTAKLCSVVGTLQPTSLGRIVPGMSGTLQGALGSSDSKLRAEEIEARFLLRDLIHDGWHVGDVDVEATIVEGGLDLRAHGESLDARMQLDADGSINGRMNAGGTVLRKYTGGKKRLRGEFAAEGTMAFSGKLDALEKTEIDLQVDCLYFELDSLHVRTTAPFSAKFTESRSWIKEVRANTSLGKLILMGYAASDSLNMIVRISPFDLGGMIEGARSSGSGEFALIGSMAQPQLLGTLTANDIHFSESLFGDLKAGLTWGHELQIDAYLSQFGTPAARLRMKGDSGLAELMPKPLQPSPTGADRQRNRNRARQTVLPTDLLKFDLDVTDLDLAAPLTSLLGQPTNGVADFDLNLAVPFSDLAIASPLQKVSGEFLLERLGVGTDRARLALSQPVTIAGRSGSWQTAELDLEFGVSQRDTSSYLEAGRVRVIGTVAAKGSGLDARVELDEVDLDVFEGFGAPDLPMGTVTGRITMRDSLDLLHFQATAEAILEDLGDVRGAVQGRLGNTNAEVVWNTPAGDELRATLQVPWPPDPEISSSSSGSLTLQAEAVDLFVFLDQIPQLEDLQGSVGVDLHVDDLTTLPRFAGAIDLEDLEFTVLDVNPAYKIPSGQLRFAGRRGKLNDVVGGPVKGDGQFSLTGIMGLSDHNEVELELHLKAESLPYNYDDVFEVPAIDLDLQYEKTGMTARLAGYARLDEALVEPTLIDLSAPPVPPPAAVPDETLEELELDIKIDMHSLHVENELSDLDMVGDARVYGSFYKPRFQGQMQVEQGQVFLLNRQFDIRKGRINLDRLVPTYSLLELAYDPLLLNPEMDVEASATVQPIDAEEADESYEVHLFLNGPAQEVAPRFECGGLTDAQILTLLAFGYRSVNQLTEDDYQGAKSALYTAAGQLLLSRRVKKIGLDEFQILPSGTALGTVGKTSVRLGKYLEKPLPLWLRYEASTEEPSLGEIRVEHKLWSFLTLTGTAQSEYERYGLGIGLNKAF